MTTTCDNCASPTCRDCYPDPPPPDTRCTACSRMKCGDCGVCGCTPACISCGGPLSTRYYIHPAESACWCPCACTALLMERHVEDADI